MTQSLNQLLLGYLPLVVFIGVAGVIGLALLLSAFLLAYKRPDPEKLSAYECGFRLPEILMVSSERPRT